MGKNKSLGVDKQGITLTMGKKDIWGYGAGVGSMAVISNLVGQITFFYTDKIGLSASLAGSALLIAKIADAFTDLIMGYIVDKTNTKYGKARPWLLWMVLPVLFGVAVLLCMPAGLSDSTKFIYAIVSNVIASAIISTAISVPYACLLNYRTESQLERTKMNVSRTIVNYMFGMFFSVAFIPLTNLLGGTQYSWIMLGMAMAAIGAILLMVTFFSTKEITTKTAPHEINFKEDVKSLFTNKYWVIMTLAQLVANINYSLAGATGVYYAKWIFGDESLVGVMGIIGFVPAILGFLFISPLVKQFGTTKVVIGGLALGIAGSVGKMLLPYNFIAVCVFGGLVSLSTMPFMMVGMVLVSNVADFEEWRSGKKIVGLVNSASSFGAKVGSGVGAGLIGWVLSAGGYDGSASAQTESAMISILGISTWIPAALVVALFVLILLFDIDKKFPDYRSELAKRRQMQNEK